jgi:hypothetical protein
VLFRVLQFLELMPANSILAGHRIMTKDQIACWKLMAKALQEILPFLDAVAESECKDHLAEWPYKDMAYGLEWVIALEEIVRPGQEELVAR